MRGQEEGVKDRPCAVVLVTQQDDADEVVTVLPVTHTSPADPALASEIPAMTRRRLGLDAERSWVILSEANRFVWPGPDLRPLRNEAIEGVVYGTLPYALAEEIRLKFIENIKTRRLRIVQRTE